MGDVADDAERAAEREEELREVLLSVCEQTPKGKNCIWDINDDGLYECQTCGKVTDI
jgi:hypothetical protein